MTLETPQTQPASRGRTERRPGAIIVGAASPTGAWFAHALSSRGFALLLADRDEVALMRAHPQAVDSVRCDVLSDSSVSAMFDRAEESLGSAGLLINAAGSGYIRTLGTMRLNREFARRRGPGKAMIVNLASGSSRDGGPIRYAGSKSAFERLAEGIARAIQRDDLRVLIQGPAAAAAEVEALCDQLVAELSDYSDQA